MLNARERMAELMAPVDKQILKCNDDNEVLMMASCLLSTAKLLFDEVLGKEGTKTLFMECLRNEDH